MDVASTSVRPIEIAALSLAFLCGEQEGDNRTEAVWESSSELGYGRPKFEFHIGMELGRERIKIVCYPHDGKGGPKVASAYIELA